jgi:hypothetical protein
MISELRWLPWRLRAHTQCDVPSQRRPDELRIGHACRLHRLVRHTHAKIPTRFSGSFYRVVTRRSRT